jgi:hypothetical protein
MLMVWFGLVNVVQHHFEQFQLYRGNHDHDSPWYVDGERLILH